MPGSGGIHGCGMRRDCGYLYGGSADWVKRMNDIVIAVMIEKKGAVENLEEILSVEGLDMVQFGPADYSISIGKPGERGCPEVQKAHADMIELALKKRVVPRVEVVSFEQARPFWDTGVRHFCIGWDLITISNWCREQAKGIRDLMA
jgi:2-keto-3-deoxy-L-rhamnonate aldolase RhmA